MATVAIKIDDKQKRNFILERNLSKRIDSMLEERGITFSDLCRHLLKKWLSESESARLKSLAMEGYDETRKISNSIYNDWAVLDGEGWPNY